VEDELADAVGESADVALGHVGGKVFDTRERVSVCAFAAEEFDEGLLGHFYSAQIINH
jgi:hypothetical protein